MWDLVPSFYVQTTEKSFAINFGKNQLFRTESSTIVFLGRLLRDARDFFHTALHKSRLQRALLKRRQHPGKTITITPKTWWMPLAVSFLFCPLTFAGIAMLSWLLATWLVLYLSYESAQIVTKVTRRLLNGPVQTFILIIWNVARSVQLLLVTSGPTGKSVLPYLQLKIQPHALGEAGFESPRLYKQPISPWCEQSTPSWSNPPSELGLLLPESVGEMFIQHGQLPRVAPLSPLPKERRRRAKAVVNRMSVEVN
jgi:hypothetical protein